MEHWFAYTLSLALGISIGIFITRQGQRKKLKNLNTKCRTLINRIRDKLLIKINSSDSTIESCETFLSHVEDTVNKTSLILFAYENAFHQLNEGVLVLNNEGLIELLNPPLLSIIQAPGYIEEWQKRPFFELIRNADVMKTVENIRKRKTREEMISISHRDKKLSIKIKPSGNLSNGGGSFIILIFADMTQNIRTVQAEKDMVANVAHQLRTPLTSIKGYAETLLDGAMQDPEISRRFLEAILRNADRLTKLVRDILLLARLDAKGEEKAEEVILDDAIDHVFESVSHLARDKGIKIRVEAPENIVSVQGSPQNIEQAIMNLVDNAIKYSEKNTQIKIRLKEKEKDVIISVEDHGPGLPADAMDKVFDRFYRLEGEKKPGLIGTGLGLAIVRQIAENHGGRTWAKSRMGEGSTFFISFPKS